MDSIPDKYDTGAWGVVLCGKIEGQPHGQPRGRHVRGRVVSWAAASAPVKLYRQHVERCVAATLRDAGGVQGSRGELRLDAHYLFATGQAARWGKLHTHKPDADNLAKLLMDAMQTAGALGGDDRKIASLNVTKHWAERGSVAWRLSRLRGHDFVIVDDVAALPPWLLGEGEAPA